MSYRPYYWKKIMQEMVERFGNPLEIKIGELECNHKQLIEAGADAILEALRAKGTPFKRIETNSRGDRVQSGVYVVIPDGKKK